MTITEVRIFRKESPDKKLRAFVTITIDDQFVVRDMKVIEGKKGLFVAMPSRRIKTKGEADRMDDVANQDQHRDIAHPITTECREYIQKVVLEAYEKEVRRAGD